MLIQNSRSEAAPARPQAHPQQTLQDRLAGKRALIVEDDEILSRFLERLLRVEGLSVQKAHTGASALEQLGPEIDLVVLDLNLPEVDGITVLEQLRGRFPELPVLVLTARNRSEGTLRALASGADDCLIKPFSHVELLARVRALLRRKPERPVPEATSAELTLREQDFSVTRNGQRIDLTPREFGLLAILARTPGVPVSRSALLKELWGQETSPSSNVVDVYMKYVRDKVDLPGWPKLIRTVRGVGYVLSARDTASRDPDVFEQEADPREEEDTSPAPTSYPPSSLSWSQGCVPPIEN